MAPPIWVFLIVFSCKFSFVFPDDYVESCARNDAIVEREGRLCPAPCTRKRTCRSPERECRCDGACGRTCVAKGLECKLLNNPSGGVVSVTNMSLGAIAIYYCNRGFALVGPGDRFCQGDGFWSGVEPSCEEQVRCFIDILPRLEGVLYPKKLMDWYLTGETVGFICSSTYQLTSGHLRGEVQCFEGQWVHTKDICEPRSCPPFLSTDPLLIIQSQKVFKHGESLEIFCYDQFILKGSSRLICQFGEWTMPEGRTYCQNVEFEDENVITDTINSYPDNNTPFPNHLKEIETTEIPSTEEPETDDGTIIPEIKWIFLNGSGVEIAPGKLAINENTDLHLTCTWPLPTKQKLSWSYTESRESENYKLEWDETAHEFHLTIWSIQEDDAGTYTCISPRGKQKNNLEVRVLRKLSESLEKMSNYDLISHQTVDSCQFRHSPNIIAWYKGYLLREDDYIPDRGTLIVGCRYSGLFAFVGLRNITCNKGQWMPENNAECIRLKRNSELSPPPIEISAAYTMIADGSIAVNPREYITLDCMWVMPPEPQDTWHHPTWYRTDQRGDIVLPATIVPHKTRYENVQYYSYRIEITGSHHNDITYTCMTPEDARNSIRIRFSHVCSIRDAAIPLNVEVHAAEIKHYYVEGERIQFPSCKGEKILVGLDYISCLSNGQWSKPLFNCR